MLRVYRIPFSTNVERVALAAAHKRLDVEWVDVDPADRGPVRRASGQELVPVLEHDGRVIADSTAILRHLEEHRPEPALWPAEPSRRAELDVFVDWFNRVWKRPPNELEAELRRARPERARVDALAAAVADTSLFEGLLQGRDFLFGDEFSAADVVAFPFLKYALLREDGDEELFHRILHDHLELDGRPALAAWIRRVDALPRA